MKTYAITGQSAEVTDRTSNPVCPAGHIEMLEPRPSPEYVAQEDGTWALVGQSTEQQIADIKARLNQIDLDSVRPLRAIAAGEAVQADHDKLAALAGEASALREQLATLTAVPDNSAS